jgi:hypothetical protein
MLRPKQIVTIAALLASLTSAAGLAIAAAAGSNQRGGKAAEHMSAKGASNNNAQWSADPVRGWVRADERHKAHEKLPSAEPTGGKDTQQKQKGKGRKS